MSASCFVIEKIQLQEIFNILKDDYSVIGPRIKDNVIIFDKISFDDIPAGYVDMQGQGYYRLKKEDGAIFSFVNGPDSMKRFLHSPFEVKHTFSRTRKGVSIIQSEKDSVKPYAFFAVRPCDVRAAEIHDLVFSGETATDNEFRRKRKEAFIAVVNCIRAGENCFCTSMGSGPEAVSGFDIALTELDDVFLLTAGTQKGHAMINSLHLKEAADNQVKIKNEIIETCRNSMKKTMKTDDLPEFLYRNLESSKWHEVSERCLACGNCTQVCPTCFCNSSFDYVDMEGLKSSDEFTGRRLRVWDSCFSANFARVHGGNFREARWARYRHWFSHKLAYWIEQYGVSGCVGCGRCITWCPVGIDITEEMDKLRKQE